MGFAACSDWYDTGVCYSLLGVDGSLGHPDLWADVHSIYFVLFPDISFIALFCVRIQLAWQVWHTLVSLCRSGLLLSSPHITDMLLLCASCASSLWCVHR